MANSFRLQAILLTLICFVFYGNTLCNGYAVDDDWVIVKNEAVSQGIAGIPKILTSDMYESYYRQYNAGNQLGGGRYRPLSLVSFAVEQQLFGQKDGGYNSTLLCARHLVNVLLYLLSVLVLLYFLRKTIFVAQPLLAFFSVLLFAIHPVHTEVVDNIKSRDEILSLLFITLTCMYAWKYQETHKKLHAGLALLYFLLALLSKEYAVTLIVLLPLLFYLCKNYTAIKSVKTVLPYVAVLGGYLVFRFTWVPLQRGVEDTEVLNNPYLLATGSQKTATEVATLLRYVKLLILPHPLSADYSYRQIPYVRVDDLLPWLSLVFHAGLVAALIYGIIKRRAYAFAIAFYLANLFLVSNLVFNIGAPMGERLIYHSSVGFCIGVGWLLYQGYVRMAPVRVARFSVTAVLLLLVVLSGIKTITRNEDWESNSTLYRKDVVTAPNSAITNANAGLSYLNDAPLQFNETARQEALHTAMNYFNKAISIHPGYTFAFINRGTAFFELGDWDRAKQDWDTVQQQFPGHPDLPGLYAAYYINTSTSKYGSKGQYEEAIAELRKGAAWAPQNIIILFNLGYYYNLAGKKEAAINAFQQVIDLKPADTLAVQSSAFINMLKKAP